MPKEQRTIFLENPYDIETLFESLQIAVKDNKELLFMDRLIATIRLDPEVDVTNLNFRILSDLRLMELNNKPETIKTNKQN